MGMIRRSFTFMAGTVFGVYIAQNYNVANVGKLLKGGYVKAKNLEETHRKPNTTKPQQNDIQQH
ncbi:hypothetical protein ACS0TY_019640 [Phlomoides rotata]